ncbi:MAG: hypothetical protein EPO26_18670 [Chloroflexota bacterium]|nr:MAG: hypothetical protein EPO26_18670 [Chloroflexota bacterium]
MSTAEFPSARVDIVAFAPTEFFHCQHCEMVWHQIGVGQAIHAEQRSSGLLPPELESEYREISEWARDAAVAYGSRLVIRIIDAASIEGVWWALRHRIRRFPAFFVDGGAWIDGFDRSRLDAAVAARVGGKPSPVPADGRRREPTRIA